MTSLTISGGTLSGDQTSVLISGTIDPADAALPIQIFNGSQQVAQVTADSSGNWTASVDIAASGVYNFTAQATGSGGAVTSNTLVALQSATDSYGSEDEIMLLAGSGNVVTLTGRDTSVTAGGNGQAATATTVFEGGGQLNAITVLDNSRLDVWNTTGFNGSYNVTLGSFDNLGIVGYADNVTVNGQSDNIWIGDAGNITAWASTGLNVTVLDHMQGNLAGNGITTTIGSYDNYGIWGSDDTTTVTGSNDNLWIGGNTPSAAVTDFVDASAATGLVLHELVNSRVDVTGDGITAYAGGQNVNLGVYGSAETIILSAGANAWVGGNGQSAAVTDQIYTDSSPINLTELDNSRVDISGGYLTVTLGNHDNFGVFGGYEAVTAIGTGDTVWIGENQPIAPVSDTVDGTQATDLVVNELDNSRADVTGDAVTTYIGNNDNLGQTGQSDVVIATGNNDNIWIGGNGQDATTSDRVYATQATDLTLTVLNDSRVDFVVDGTTITSGYSDNIGVYGSGDSVFVIGDGESVWIGGNGQNAGAADSVDLYYGGNVHVLDSSQVSVSGGNGTIGLGANDALTFGQTIGNSTVAGFGSSDQITLQQSSFGSQSAGFDYWAYLLGHATMSGGDTTITTDGSDSIVLKGVTLTSANQSQFKFV